MANSYSQLYVQLVFVVKHRQNLISESNREELQKYMTRIVQNRGHKLLAVYCMPNHTHLLVGLRPSQSVSDLVRDIKSSSSNFINEKKWGYGIFSWQEGFGAFSYAQGQIGNVIRYIENQEEHHKKKSFKEEYHEFLEEFKVEYKEEYLFEWV